MTLPIAVLNDLILDAPHDPVCVVLALQEKGRILEGQNNSDEAEYEFATLDIWCTDIVTREDLVLAAEDSCIRLEGIVLPNPDSRDDGLRDLLLHEIKLCYFVAQAIRYAAQEQGYDLGPALTRLEKLLGEDY